MSGRYTDLRFSDMVDKGFLAIPSFLSSEDISFLLADYNSQEEANNSNYSVVPVKEPAIEKIREKIEEVISNVNQFTDITIDASCMHIGYYFATEKINFGWHQDHESFYALQNHYDYLNFFIPIQKPIREKSNLCLIPWDILKDKYPEQYKKLVKSGGNNTHVIGNKTFFTEDKGLSAEIPINIKEICSTPELNAGDLLLVRGDTIHQTQDSDTDRIAISIRFTNPETSVSHRELLTGGKRKTHMMINNWTDFAPIFRAFKNSGSKIMSWKQLQDAIKKEGIVEADVHARGKIVLFKLWVQRLKNGVFFTSLKRWLESNRIEKFVSALKS